MDIRRIRKSLATLIREAAAQQGRVTPGQAAELLGVQW